MKTPGQNYFKGKVVEVSSQKVRLPNNHEIVLDVVKHPGGAAVVAVNENRQICLINQYRAVFDRWFWELPAGKRDNEEPALDTAQRELAEEAGLKASEWQDLGVMVSSPGVFTEEVFLFLAAELSSVQSSIAADEVIGELRWLDLEEACKWAISGKISDAKSVIGILRAAEKLR